MEEPTQVVSLALSSCTQGSSNAKPSIYNVVVILGIYTNDMANKLFGPLGFITKTHTSMTSPSSTSIYSYLSLDYYANSKEMIKECIC